ncbi:MAG: DUF86 domain-containing protein [Calditrichaeota bacterium]|nr:MAG: DUF86 domain-containing protein [Calditrichota bacterium]
MEQTKRYEFKLIIFEKVLDTFEKSLKVDLGKFSEIELDTFQNGQVQKFEYCVEICWKTIKSFLEDVHGLESVSPKSAFKVFFQTGSIDEETCESLFEMINDRNRLSHIYENDIFNEIYKKLPIYLEILKSISTIIKNN